MIYQNDFKKMFSSLKETLMKNFALQSVFTSSDNNIFGDLYSINYDDDIFYVIFNGKFYRWDEKIVIATLLVPVKADIDFIKFTEIKNFISNILSPKAEIKEINEVVFGLQGFNTFLTTFRGFSWYV